VGAYLTIRIWTGPDSSSAWHGSGAESGLATDLITASGGTAVDAQGSCLLARFPAVQTAALAARRLQWAAQGFTESNDHPAEFCILVQSGEESSGELDEQAAWQAFEETSPGQILLSDAAAHALEPVPAFVVRPASRGSLRELAWRAPGNQTTREADEAAVARFIGLYNRAEASADGSGNTVTLAAVDQAQRVPISQDGMPGTARTSTSFKLVFWIGGVVAAAILVVVAVGYFNRKAPTEAAGTPTAIPTPAASQIAASNPPPTRAQPPQAPPAQTEAAPAPPALTRAQKKKLEKEKAQQADQQATATKPPEVDQSKKPDQPRGDCQYSMDELPDLLGRAENSRARHNYADARRKFTAVLACQPGNAQARGGVELVRQAQALEGSIQ
jgi:hypothetical protein